MNLFGLHTSINIDTNTSKPKEHKRHRILEFNLLVGPMSLKSGLNISKINLSIIVKQPNVEVYSCTLKVNPTKGEQDAAELGANTYANHICTNYF